MFLVYPYGYENTREIDFAAKRYLRFFFFCPLGWAEGWRKPFAMGLESSLALVA